nr:AAA family ATPase [Halovulum dunhuangense]
MVAIAGAPGSGKSTLAQLLVDALVARDGDGAAEVVPMDGYHLDNTELDLLGLRDVKGAPQTFDAAGFLGLVRQIRSDPGAIRYPLFDRSLDATLPDAGELSAATRVVVFEGNYLLLTDPVWVDLARLFDVTVMLCVPLDELRSRLIDRWLGYGLSRADAVARAEGNDLANARHVIANSAPAHLTLGSGAGEMKQEGRTRHGGRQHP